MQTILRREWTKHLMSGNNKGWRRTGRHKGMNKERVQVSEGI